MRRHPEESAAAFAQRAAVLEADDQMRGGLHRMGERLPVLHHCNTPCPACATDNRKAREETAMAKTGSYAKYGVLAGIAGAKGGCASGDTAQTTHNGATVERYFTRSEALTVLRAIEASRGGITEAITAFERL